MMNVKRIVKAGTTRPFGDERTVTQAFPAAIPSEESDPFLMCDNFAFKSMGAADDPDHFPVDWHPHRGMDILSYIKTGLGRHGDSMGNRETFATPGMQWISCGSGIEHAEGGGTAAGKVTKGFQLWINVPAKLKMEDPRYGTEPPESIPKVQITEGVTYRLLAGAHHERTGPFKTVASVQMMDFDLAPGSTLSHTVPVGHNTAMLYVYEGAGAVCNGRAVPEASVVLFDAEDADGSRSFELTAGPEPVVAILFSGTKLREPIAWHGPIVMNTQAEIRQCFSELRSGTFPPKAVGWDYRRLDQFPSDHPARAGKHKA